MDDTRDIAQDSKDNIDQEVGITTFLKENSNRWNKDCKDNLNNVTKQVISYYYLV